MGSALNHESVAGVIDVHCHCDPDSLPRPIDAIDLARLARSRGMRGLVLKNHYESTCTANLILGHLSEQNNHPAIVQMVAAEALGQRGLETSLDCLARDTKRSFSIPKSP